ncbi:hypothetical protein [Luteolibacter sp. Populi]|uniref:hypothetical protein n=1 Tax=Luteolibacter sp. Populi TaxID=3230487 RepID=UPI0034652C5B
MRIPALTSLLLGLTLFPLHAELREWKNADGSQSFQGEYVSHDSGKVTIRRKDGRLVTLEKTRLNAADHIWLSDKPMTEKIGADLPAAETDGKAVFDTLRFGDKREEVTRKLKASTLVESTMDEVMMGRVGLNGVFRTRKQIGGLHCELYFGFSGASALKEISLQTQTVPKAVYVNRLKATWTELAELLTTLHGKPVQEGPFPPASSLLPDALVPSHLWKLSGGGSALLGTSMEGDKCMIVVRFTTERIQPVAVP